MLLLFIWLAKILTLLLRITKQGGGSSLPGLFIERHFPQAIKKLARQIPKIILITGTNGKTTTQKLLVHTLEKNNLKVVSNPSGANLFRGITSSLMNSANWLGKIKTDYAVFEVEEATMPILTKYVKPDLILITNIFRDQLDAYGGIDILSQKLKTAVNQTKAEVILNGNDPILVTLAKHVKNPCHFVKINKNLSKEIMFEGGKAGTNPLKKSFIDCKKITVNPDLSSTFYIDEKKYELSAPGFYNVLNALMVIAAIKLKTKIKDSKIQKAIKSFKAPWGRGEMIKTRNKKTRLLLIKNPAGFSIVLKTLSHLKKINLLIAINDNIADGRDVSWLWDVDNELFENLNIKNLLISGTRAEDMNVRIKYTNAKYNKKFIDKNFSQILKKGLKQISDGEILYVLPTYTALLGIRKGLGKITNVKNFWR